MQLVIFGRERPFGIPKAKKVFIQNRRSERAFYLAKKAPLFFLLTNEQQEILAECAVHPQLTLFSEKVHSYLITDVYVPFEFRGNEYAVLLILNVLFLLWTPQEIPVYIYADRHNPSAVRCYKKIFGEPTRTTRFLAIFGTHRPTTWCRWFC